MQSKKSFQNFPGRKALNACYLQRDNYMPFVFFLQGIQNFRIKVFCDATSFLCMCGRVHRHTSEFCSRNNSTVEIGRLRRNSARLRHSALCSIYGAKKDLPKNSMVLWSSVVSKLLPLWPKEIKNELNFRKWTIKKINNLCQNSIKFMLNF